MVCTNLKLFYSLQSIGAGVLKASFFPTYFSLFNISTVTFLIVFEVYLHVAGCFC
jgi:hypothetical protein